MRINQEIKFYKNAYITEAMIKLIFKKLNRLNRT